MTNTLHCRWRKIFHKGTSCTGLAFAKDTLYLCGKYPCGIAGQKKLMYRKGESIYKREWVGCKAAELTGKNLDEWICCVRHGLVPTIDGVFLPDRIADRFVFFLYRGASGRSSKAEPYQNRRRCDGKQFRRFAWCGMFSLKLKQTHVD